MLQESKQTNNFKAGLGVVKQGNTLKGSEQERLPIPADIDTSAPILSWFLLS